MQIKVERFLAITALLASTAAVAAGCSSEDVATDTDAGVTGGSGGVGGGQAGAGGQAGGSTGGTAGQAGGGGTAGVAGGGGTAGSDAGVECLGDTPQNDAGIEFICDGLPYATTTCPGDPDAGIEGGGPPLGYSLCTYMEAHGRPGVTEELYNCLGKINETDQCSSAHDDAVQKCIDDTFALACTVGPVTVGDAGAVDCAFLASTCPAVSGGTTGVTESQCQQALSSMNEQTRVDIVQCYNDAAPATNDCALDFTACVYTIDNYNTP